MAPDPYLSPLRLGGEGTLGRRYESPLRPRGPRRRGDVGAMFGNVIGGQNSFTVTADDETVLAPWLERDHPGVQTQVQARVTARCLL
jgi:hypothetical protein